MAWFYKKSIPKSGLTPHSEGFKATDQYVSSNGKEYGSGSYTDSEGKEHKKSFSRDVDKRSRWHDDDD